MKFSALFGSLLVSVFAIGDDLAARVDAGWAQAMTTWNPRTGVVTGCDSRKSLPPPDATNNLYRMYKGRPGGWGPPGVGDAPLICGTALSGLVDKWAVTRDPAVKEEAAKVAKGVLNLAVLHGYKGFVCRGFCSDDKTTVSLSSRDQYTHWVHGLWRYVTADGLADPQIVAEYRVRVAEVAAFMEARVTAAHGWNFGLADSPEKDYRGICTMWGPEIWPHEAARLPMIYCAAFLATGDAHWRDLYETFIDEALDRTLKIKEMSPQKIAGRMPCYSLFQANTSFEPILAYERNPARVAKIKAAMAAFADHARRRAKGANPAKPPYGMCWDGELALTQLMAPEIPDRAELAAFVAETVRRQDLARSGVCRAAHVMAAYWRWRRGRAPDLEAGFRNPPAEAKPQVWWHWMAGNVTRAGITADLEAMARVGIGGAILFDAGLGIRWGVPEGPLVFNTPEWYETVRFAAQEAKRLGLELGMANCSGWANSGGPWNTPAHAMKTVCLTATPVAGGARFEGALPQPKDEVGFYRDIAVVAFPSPAEAFELKDWTFKCFSNPGRKYDVSDARVAPEGAVVRRAAVVDLTSRMKDGRLVWDAPAGAWTVLRVGYKALNRQNGTGSRMGKGLECDKLSKEALRLHWANYVGKTVQALGPELAGPKGSLRTVLNDSYEVGTQNWTQGFEAAFEKRNGYAILPWLPALAGRVVDSVAATERFYRDFRLTVTELFAENYAGEMRRLAHASGLRLAIEPYGEIPSDDLLYGEHADIPTAEFWAKLDSPHWVRQAASIAHAKGRRIVAAESFTTNAREGRWQNTPWSMKAKCDWVYAEGLNRIIYHRFAHQPWTAPARLPGMTMGPFGVHYDRTQTWWELAKGWHLYQQRCQWMLQEGTFVCDAAWYCPAGYLYINWGHNPHRMPVPVAPGFTYDFVSGTSLAEMTVRDGRLVLPSGQGYAFLILPEKAFALPPDGVRHLARLRAAGATVVPFEEAVAFMKARTPDFAAEGGKVNWIHRRAAGADYWFVASPETGPRRVVCSFRIAGRRPELWDPETGRIAPVATYAVKDGVTTLPITFGPCASRFVVFRAPETGTPPATLPPEAPRVARAVDFALVKAEYGVFGDAAHPPADVTRQLAGGVRDGRLVCARIHHNAFRIADPAENRVKTLRVTYRADGVEKVAAAQEGGALELPCVDNLLLDLPGEPVGERPVAGAWHVAFPNGFKPNALARGAEERVVFDALVDWTKRPEEGIRHFSGTAAYARTIDLAGLAVPAGGKVILDLGEVRDFAEVTVNGRTFPVLWKPPFRVDVTEAARRGQPLNVAVRVTNLWPNRLIGDDFKAEDCDFAQGTLMERHLNSWPAWVLEGRESPSGKWTFATWKHWTKDEPLLPSGLLGPVVLRAVK